MGNLSLFKVGSTFCSGFAGGALVPLLLCAGTMQVSANETLIKFGARADAPPMSYKDEKGEFRGYTIDICRRVFRTYQKYRPDTNMRLEFVEVNAYDRFKMLDSGAVSAICGATTITVERMKRYNFSFFTFISGASVMAKIPTMQALALQPKAAEGGQSSDVRVAVVSDTTTQDRMEQLLGTAVSLIAKPTHYDALKALEAGEVQYYVGDRVILQRVLKDRGQNAELRVGSQFLTYEPYAIPFSINQRELLVAANEAISELYRSGDFKTLYESYFPDSRPSQMLGHMYELFAVPTGSPAVLPN